MKKEVVTYDYTGLNVHYYSSSSSMTFTYRCSLWRNKALNVFSGNASIRTRT